MRIFGPWAQGKSDRLKVLRILVVALILSAIMVPVLLFARTAIIALQTFIPTRPGLEEVSEITGLAFPESARLEASRDTGRHFKPVLLASIRIDPSDIGQFSRQELLRAALVDATDTDRREFVDRLVPDDETVKAWWRVADTRQLKWARRGEDYWGKQRSMYVLLDLDDAKEVVVYIADFRG